MLKLKDWPSLNASEEFLIYHRPDFIIKLPLLEFIHLKWGLLNVTAELPHYSMQDDVGPKIEISYGTYEELDREPAYDAWEQSDSAVRSWILGAMDPALDGKDTVHLFELRKKVNQTKQNGGIIDQYFGTLQGYWREIDLRRPNPMKTDEDIHTYNQIIQEERLNIFLDGLNDKLDATRRDILNTHPVPSLAEAYAMVRREIRRQTVMNDGGIPDQMAGGVGLAMKSRGKVGVSAASGNTENVASGGWKPQNEGTEQRQARAAVLIGTEQTEEATGGKARELRVALISQKDKNAPLFCDTMGQLIYDDLGFVNRFSRPGIKIAGSFSGANTIANGPELLSNVLHCRPEISNSDYIAMGSNATVSIETNLSQSNKGEEWILDSGATDHMTFSRQDISQITQPRKSSVFNANGIPYPVSGAGSIELTPTLKLSNDIRTREIIGRGTERDGLYYVDDVTRTEVESPEYVTVQSENNPTGPGSTSSSHITDIVQSFLPGQLDTLQPSPDTNDHEVSIPERSPEPEYTIESVPPNPTGYVLPQRINRGIPPKRFCPDCAGCKSQYPIAHHMTIERMEPSSFEQRLGRAVFIPAGCPFQVKNLQSKRDLKLAEEIRGLPGDDDAKLQRLEVRQ
ncbi:hypothetical protein ACH5RR_017820 [Cinchona calisaya]|uniref:Retrovirus-related Pol polyprotein from transposon TNT 1-94-like beta-barrel domain-containing protein n=1 Tax=Cinchona calisaya TaxID=153742 RepID=A0ABD2ZLF1_9GENT